jgi:hypothetical protein
VLSRQQSIQTEILADIPTAIIQSSHDQIAELRRVIKTLVDGFHTVEQELRMIREAG